MTWAAAASRIRLRARIDANEGRPSDPRGALRIERMPRMSPFHYRSLCQEYERTYTEAKGVAA